MHVEFAQSIQNSKGGILNGIEFNWLQIVATIAVAAADQRHGVH